MAKSSLRIIVLLSLMVCLVLILNGVSFALEYKEAPMLADKVASGTLPPVEERLPLNPLVWDNEWNHEIGNYGGTIRGSTYRFPEQTMCIGFGRVTSDRQGYVFDLAESWEWGNDWESLTIFLREGVKWSDGIPFTAQDIMFWWNDIIRSDYLPEPLGAQGFDTVNDNIVMIDDYTIRLEFAKPNPQFLFTTRGWLGGQQGHHFRAAHYWKQFHPKYNPDSNRDPLEQMLEFATMITGNLNDQLNWGVGFPVLSAWVPIEYVEDQHLLMERNPYFWTVDREGNQLPYADYVQSYMMTDGDTEAIQIRVIAGEVDWERRIGTVSDIPLYRQFEEHAGIKLTYTVQPVGSLQGIYIGQNHPDSAKREILQNADFRRALSLALDRETVKELSSLGLGRIGQGYSPPMQFDPAIDGSYADFDPEQAGLLLDGIGLDKRDSEGYRIMPNGDRFTFTLLFTPGWLEGVTELAEISTENWRDIGIRANARPVDHSIRNQRRASGDVDAWIHPSTGGLPTYGLNYGFALDTSFSFAQHQWNWWNSRDWPEESRPENIVEPEGALREACELIEKIRDVVTFSKEFYELYDKYLELQADQIWVIGSHQDTPKVFISNKYLQNIPGSASPEEASIILGTGDEEFPSRAFYYEQEYFNKSK